MKHLKLFKNSSELDNGVKVETPNVSYLENKNVLYIPSSVGKEATIVYKQEDDEIHYKLPIPAVKFTAKQANSTVGLSKKSTGQTLEYSTDFETWNNMTTATTVNLSSGESIYVRGILSSNQTLGQYTHFSMTGDIKASGNINYLWNKNNPDTPLKDYCGCNLFNGCTALTDVSELTLPATALTQFCYVYMFSGCRLLTTAPELPATTLAYSCYSGMFRNCTSLTTVPELPATTLAETCYNAMFDGCTNLTTAPTLPATNLAEYCYQNMFSGCTSLTTAPELPATTLKSHCYKKMFLGCTSLTTAPVLPATTLASWCYDTMFASCTNLNYIKCLATSISATECTFSWVYNVASSGTFIKNAKMSSWKTGDNGIPTGWTIQNA